VKKEEKDLQKGKMIESQKQNKVRKRGWAFLKLRCYRSLKFDDVKREVGVRGGKRGGCMRSGGEIKTGRRG